MAALANISIADSVPTTRIFAPVNIDAAGVAKLADRSGGIAIGFPVLSMSVRPPSKTSRAYKVLGKIVVPVLEVTAPSTASGIQPAPTKAYELIGTIEFVLPERSTGLERANLLALMKNFAANVNITNAVSTFETIY